VDLRNFKFWSGAKDTEQELTTQELDSLQEMLEDMYPDGMTDTELNDIFWFETDLLAEWLGYADWEDLEAHHDERWE
jgi:hypothetical protein